MSTALFRPEVWHSMDPDGYLLLHGSSCPSVFSAASSAASSSLDSSNSLSKASCSSTSLLQELAKLPSASASSCTSSIRTSGSSTPSRPSAEASMSFTTWLATHTASPSPTIASSPARRIASPSASVKDYAHGGKQKVMTVSTDEFLRRFLIHVLPKRTGSTSATPDYLLTADELLHPCCDAAPPRRHHRASATACARLPTSLPIVLRADVHHRADPQCTGVFVRLTASASKPVASTVPDSNMHTAGSDQRPHQRPSQTLCRLMLIRACQRQIP